jgi:hypothetical protein
MSRPRPWPRRPGSEWLKNHPRLLEGVYLLSKWAFGAAYPLMSRVNSRLARRFMVRSEAAVKGYVFNCQMCGQCTLHSSGMTCPMTCPKNLRNGPCGGVRADGHCEVIPEMPCVWVQAWERSRRMPLFGEEIRLVQPPTNHTLKGSSAWINMYEGVDRRRPTGWQAVER